MQLPLGITGEIAEFEAARILGVELSVVRTPGYDAIERIDGKDKKLLQVKGRCLQPNAKPGRLSCIRVHQPWDAVLMVLLDHEFDAVEIWEAQRPEIVAALTAPGSKAWKRRGSLAVSKFKSIGKLRWTRAT